MTRWRIGGGAALNLDAIGSLDAFIDLIEAT
jgi:hypothetical protein